MLNRVIIHETLVATDDALQKVDSVALVWCQICVALHGEEHIPTALVTVMKGTYTSRFDLYLAANIAAVTFLFAFARTGSTMLSLFLIITRVVRQVSAIDSAEDPN